MAVGASAWVGALVGADGCVGAAAGTWVGALVVGGACAGACVGSGATVGGPLGALAAGVVVVVPLAAGVAQAASISESSRTRASWRINTIFSYGSRIAED